jgi:hypothetical protein
MIAHSHAKMAKLAMAALSVAAALIFILVVFDERSVQIPGTSSSVNWAQGRASFGVGEIDKRQFFILFSSEGKRDTLWNRVFASRFEYFRSGFKTWRVDCPAWAFLMVATVFAIGSVVVHRLARWPGGSCSRCGYSLAGLNATVCPECGEQI